MLATFFCHRRPGRDCSSVRIGINAVPFSVVVRALGASGAQSPEVFGELLKRGWESQPPIAVAAEADGETCGVDGC